MKDICAWIVAIMMMIIAFRYAYQTYKKEINPAFSTWLIFLISTNLSLITYLVAERKDWLSGILNTMDTVAILIIAVSVAIWGSGKRFYFRPFEKKYLMGSGVVVVFWIVSQNAFVSNLLIQILICIGYFPTIQNLITEKRNTESFFAWGATLVACMIALYPAVYGGNLLSTVYAGRAIVMVSAVLSLMLFYGIKNKTMQRKGEK